MLASIDADTLAEWLVDGEELALLDAREQGVYFDSHHFHAACIPLSHIELQLDRLVPRRTTRVVWCDDGSSDLAARAAAKATELGWTNCTVLDGGTAAWAATGRELYSGVNVPSKAFGEFVEHAYDTPRIPAAELKAMLDRGDDLVILDSRPIDEFRRMSIPEGTDCPGAELVHRVKEMAPSPDTLVVVNCAGRTRSIIGAQSLINAGLENQVVALENGTMGWELAGFDVDRGRDVHAPDPSPETEQWSIAAASAVGERFNVPTVDHDSLRAWQADTERTTFVLDVRTPEEYAAGHLPASRNAPGGQLVQATDEYIATRNARVVLVDDNGVRATMTASWLQQLGWADAVVLQDGVNGRQLEAGWPSTGPVDTTPQISVAELSDRMSRGDALAVLDIGTSLKYRQKGHIPGAWWGVRSRLAQAHAAIGEAPLVVLTSSDGELAKLAVSDAAAHWPQARVVALTGGTKAWKHGGYEIEPGFTRPTTEPNDVWYKPYDHDGEKVAEQHMQDYLTWEIALVDQLDRDPTVNFRAYD